MQPLVSIVIPSFNAVAYIEATLGSVAAQTFSDFEVLVVDDCSKDNTAAVVEAFCAGDGRFRLIRLPRNCGAPAGPRNVGIAAARGRWIAFLDADDLWHPRKLDLQLEALERTGLKFCSTSLVNFTQDSDLKFEVVSEVSTRTIDFPTLLFRNQVPTSSVLADAQVLRRFPFNEDLCYKAREDYVCWLQCHEALGRSVKVREVLVGYRVSPSQISWNKWLMMRRHYYVLNKFRRADGSRLGLRVGFYTATHFLGAILYRRLLNTI